ncbi:hypothetical protein ACFL5E_04040, partial [Candidatus Omnitrophota bacterium]
QVEGFLEERREAINELDHRYLEFREKHDLYDHLGITEDSKEEVNSMKYFIDHFFDVLTNDLISAYVTRTTKNDHEYVSLCFMMRSGDERGMETIEYFYVDNKYIAHGISTVQDHDGRKQVTLEMGVDEDSYKGKGHMQVFFNTRQCFSRGMFHPVAFTVPVRQISSWDAFFFYVRKGYLPYDVEARKVITEKFLIPWLKDRDFRINDPDEVFGEEFLDKCGNSFILSLGEPSSAKGPLSVATETPSSGIKKIIFSEVYPNRENSEPKEIAAEELKPRIDELGNGWFLFSAEIRNVTLTIGVAHPGLGHTDIKNPESSAYMLRGRTNPETGEISLMPSDPKAVMDLFETNTTKSAEEIVAKVSDTYIRLARALIELGFSGTFTFGTGTRQVIKTNLMFEGVPETLEELSRLPLSSELTAAPEQATIAERKATNDILRDLVDSKQLSQSLAEMILSATFNKKLILAFDSNIAACQSGDPMGIFEALRKLKEDPRYARILKNLILVKAPSEELASRLEEYTDEKDTEVFLFALKDARKKLKHLESKVYSAYIDEKDFSLDSYYPLAEVVAISLAQLFENIIPDKALTKVLRSGDREIALNTLNIESVTRQDSVLIFKLLPDAEPCDTQDLIKRYAGIKRFLKAA